MPGERYSRKSFEADIAVLKTQHKTVMQSLQELKDSQAQLRQEIEELKETGDRWKGGLIVVLGLGSLIGGITTFFSNFLKMVH